MSRASLALLVCASFLASRVRAEVVSETAMLEARTSGHARVVVALAPAQMARGARLADRRAQAEQRRQRVITALAGQDLEVQHAYASVAGFSAVASEEALHALAAQPDVLRVDLDAEGGGGLATSVPQIRADRVHNRSVIGTGVVIGILDTGVVADHPDIAGALIDEQCFCSGGCCPNRRDTQSGAGAAHSGHEHGPHVAGIALSRGHVASVGTAPGASLVSVKVLDDDNRGFLSDWIAGLDWIAAEQPDVRVVNMSLASDAVLRNGCEVDCQRDQLCAENMLFAELIATLRERGTPVFVAAGNSSSQTRISSPACVSAAVSVGAVDSSDQVATFSNGGATADLLAPGVAIVSDGLGGGTAVLTGTSMAAPHATGSAALLAAARPGATAEDIEQALIRTGKPVRRGGQTAPRVDVFAAFQDLTRVTERVAGGGGNTEDCLVEWNFLPPDVARGGARPVARCRDNDPSCDGDQTEGQCTFQLSLCFNVADPLLPRCESAASISALEVEMPSSNAPAGSIERMNADALRQALPPFPLTGSNACSAFFSFVVPRDGVEQGVAYASLGARADTRTDEDRFAFVCEAP